MITPLDDTPRANIEGEIIQKVNEILNKINVVEKPIKWHPEFDGFSTTPKVDATYEIDEFDVCMIKVIPIEWGISNSTKFRMSLPFKAKERTWGLAHAVVNNGTQYWSQDWTAIVVGEDNDFIDFFHGYGGFTASGTKGVRILEFKYIIK